MFVLYSCLFTISRSNKRKTNRRKQLNRYTNGQSDRWADTQNANKFYRSIYKVTKKCIHDNEEADNMTTYTLKRFA